MYEPQANRWVDKDGKGHLPKDMTKEHLQNAIAFLEARTDILAQMKAELATRKEYVVEFLPYGHSKAYHYLAPMFGTPSCNGRYELGLRYARPHATFASKADAYLALDEYYTRVWSDPANRPVGYVKEKT